MPNELKQPCTVSAPALAAYLTFCPPPAPAPVQVLYASKADARVTTFQRVLAAGEAYCRDTRALLLRANLVQHDFMQAGLGGAGGGGGRGRKDRLERGLYDMGMGGGGGLMYGMGRSMGVLI